MFADSRVQWQICKLVHCIAITTTAGQTFDPNVHTGAIRWTTAYQGSEDTPDSLWNWLVQQM